jgi:hypothetical protein
MARSQHVLDRSEGAVGVLELHVVAHALDAAHLPALLFEQVGQRGAGSTAADWSSPRGLALRVWSRRRP